MNYSILKSDKYKEDTFKILKKKVWCIKLFLWYSRICFNKKNIFRSGWIKSCKKVNEKDWEKVGMNHYIKLLRLTINDD